MADKTIHETGFYFNKSSQLSRQYLTVHPQREDWHLVIEFNDEVSHKSIFQLAYFALFFACEQWHYSVSWTMAVTEICFFKQRYVINVQGKKDFFLICLGFRRFSQISQFISFFSFSFSFLFFCFCFAFFLYFSFILFIFSIQD